MKDGFANKIVLWAVLALFFALQAVSTKAEATVPSGKEDSAGQSRPYKKNPSIKKPDELYASEEPRATRSDKDSKAEGTREDFFQRLKRGLLPGDAPYRWAPSTPMKLKLHRPERFGIHLHNVQFRFTDQPGLETSSGKSQNQFQTSTSELEFSGSIMPDALFAQVVIEPRNVLGKGLGDSLAGRIDASNEPAGIVRDAFFDFLVDESAIFRLGQQRIPFGVETQTPGGLLPFINRASLDAKMTHTAAGQNAAFGDAELLQERDVGVQVRGTLSPYFNYAAGGFNGEGINVNDTNDRKDLVGRIGFVPQPGARFGVSGYKGTATNLRKQEVSRNRAGVDFEVLPEFLPRFRIIGEAATGNDGPYERNSWYATALYELIPQSSPTSPGLWFGVRYDEMRDDDRFSRTTFGLTYYILNGVNPVSGYWQQVKAQLNYEMRDRRGGSSADALAKDLIIAQLTARF